MSNLPLDLLSDILSRLPVKPLLRFRCVSKSFCSIIDSQDFIKLHLNRTMETNSSVSLILPSTALDNTFFLMDLDDSGDNFVEFDHPFKKCERGSTLVIGSCRGLLALYNWKVGMALLNPATKKYHILPKFWSDCYTDSTSNFYFDGFGYDVSTDGYKLVRIIQSYKVKHLEVVIYNLKANSWRRFKAFPYYILDDRCNGVFVNGSLHWLAARGHIRNGENMILAFDLKTEEFYQVSPPLGKADGFISQVGVLGECLWITCYYHDEPSCDVWVMNEYGVEESWSKLCTFSRVLHESCYYTEAFAFSKDGSKVMVYQHSRNLYWYNLKDHTLEIVEIHDQKLSMWDAVTCVGSLASLDGYVQQQ